MNRQGILIVVSGFSGAGKGTIMKALTERYEGYALSVSATTRSPRPGEEDGKAYLITCLAAPSNEGRYKAVQSAINTIIK